MARPSHRAEAEATTTEAEEGRPRLSSTSSIPIKISNNCMEVMDNSSNSNTLRPDITNSSNINKSMRETRLAVGTHRAIMVHTEEATEVPAASIGGNSRRFLIRKNGCRLERDKYQAKKKKNKMRANNRFAY